MSTESSTLNPIPSTQGIEVEEIETIDIHGVDDPLPETGIHYRGSKKHLGVQALLPATLRRQSAG